MTAVELREIIGSSEFKQELEEISSYLASIMQERPIVYLLAKCLWKLGYKFELEHDRHDLSLNGKRIEFKVSAHDGTDEIGNGTHKRAVIDFASFNERLAKKMT